jgi:hypothetical protein
VYLAVKGMKVHFRTEDGWAIVPEVNAVAGGAASKRKAEVEE